MDNQMKHSLKEYARLLVRVGINLQPGHRVVIQAPPLAWEFVQILSETSYQEGASRVYLEYLDEVLVAQQLRFGGLAQADYPDYEVNFLLDKFRDQGAYIRLHSPIPELMEGIDHEVLRVYGQNKTKVRKPIQTLVGDFHSPWVIAMYANPLWAKQVYPELEEEKALEALWQDLFAFTDVLKEDPLASQEAWIAQCWKRVEVLNGANLQYLEYQSPTAQLTIALPEGHLWNGGAEMTASGIRCMANIPTAEVYTVPCKEGVEGWVKNTRPLIHEGIKIDDFKLTFAKGKVVAYEAGEGLAQLESILQADEGSSYLGEVALVGEDAPIAAAKRVYYTTLLDENASCHLALGDSFSIALPKDAPQEVRRQLNQSDKHVDFMIGSQQLDVTGITRDGQRMPLLQKGLWVI